jgi:hypothetical protein
MHVKDILQQPLWRCTELIQTLKNVCNIGMFQNPLQYLKDTNFSLTEKQSVSLCVGFKVITTVFMKSCIFWNMTPCSPLRVNRRFRATCRLLHGHTVNHARNQRHTATGSKQSHLCLQCNMCIWWNGICYSGYRVSLIRIPVTYYYS